MINSHQKMKKLLSLMVAAVSGAVVCSVISSSSAGVPLTEEQASAIVGGACPGTANSNCENCSGSVIVSGSGGDYENAKPSNNDNGGIGGHCCTTYCFNGAVPCD